MNTIETKASLENWMDIIEDFCFDLESCVFGGWSYSDQLHKFSKGVIPLDACEEIEQFDGDQARDCEEDYRNGDKPKGYNYNAQLKLIEQLHAETV